MSDQQSSKETSQNSNSDEWHQYVHHENDTELLMSDTTQVDPEDGAKNQNLENKEELKSNNLVQKIQTVTSLSPTNESETARSDLQLTLSKEARMIQKILSEKKLKDVYLLLKENVKKTDRVKCVTKILLSSDPAESALSKDNSSEKRRSSQEFSDPINMKSQKMDIDCASNEQGSLKRKRLVGEHSGKRVKTEDCVSSKDGNFVNALKDMIPTLDDSCLEEIQKVCLNDPDSANDLMDSVMQEISFHQQRTPSVSEDPCLLLPEMSQVSNIDSTEHALIDFRFECLTSVFPNADPTYLRAKAENIGDSDQELSEFISQTLENKNYPTYEEYCKRNREADIRKSYISNFNVENFLEAFPDPLKHFYENKAHDIENAAKYLQERYHSISSKTIKQIFLTNNHNLLSSCDDLDELQPTEKIPFSVMNITECHISLIQDVAFIENRERIMNFIRDREENRKYQYEVAKASGQLMECNCCYEEECLFEEMAACTEGHIFCKACVRKSAETEIGNGKTKFPCLSDCSAEFSMKTLQSVLSASVFSKMLQRKQLEEVLAAKVEGLETCPHCNFSTIPPENDKVFYCLNPECMKETCRKCKEPNHIPLRCDEYENADEIRVRTMIEKRMTEALVRKCYNCKKEFVRSEGCNHMRCVCGAEMCYSCRKRPTECTCGDTHRYTSNHTLHVEAVRKAGEAAKKEVLAQNPGVVLKYDPTTSSSVKSYKKPDGKSNRRFRR